MTGAPGTVAGVTEFDRAENVLGPTAFTAATWKRYAVPLVSAVITADRAVPGVTVTVRTSALVAASRTCTCHEVIELIGASGAALAVHVTVAEALPRVAVPIVGAAGAVGATGVAVPDADGPVPNWFTAATWKVYSVPLVRPVTRREVAVREIPVMVWTGATVVSVPEKTRIAKLVAVAGPVKLTVTEAWAATRAEMPGAGSPAKAACLSVMPVVPVPRWFVVVAGTALFSIRSVVPVWVVGSAGLVR